MDSEQFFLKWNNFENNLTSGFADLLQQEAMVDVTLAAEGKIIQAHKIILSICSSYFRNMFQLNPCQHPIVVLKDVGYQELTDMLDFMYKGEANVRQEDLPSFLKLAETLKVKGLAGSPTEANECPKKGAPSQVSACERLSCDKDDDCNDVIDDVVVKKKRKRLTSPYKNTEINPFQQPHNIKSEVDDTSDHFMENSIAEMDHGVGVKGERLSDNSVDSCEYVNAVGKNEKDAGPSTLDDTLPQAKSTESSVYTFINSCYGKNILVHGDNCYRRKSVRKDKSYWFCSKAKCSAKGILHSNGTFTVTNQKHNHETSAEAVEKKKNLIELKRLAMDSNASTKEILQMLNIKDDTGRYSSFIRKWRSRNNKRIRDRNVPDVSEVPRPIEVGLNYKLISRHGGTNNLLLHSGYLYRHDRTVNNGWKYWRCTEKDCRARAKSDRTGYLIVLRSDHSHPAKMPDYSTMGKSSSQMECHDRIPAKKGTTDRNSSDSMRAARESDRIDRFMAESDLNLNQGVHRQAPLQFFQN